MKRRRIYTYSILGAGVDKEGFYKVHLLRNDNKVEIIGPKKAARLRLQGRITDGLKTGGGNDAR